MSKFTGQALTAVFGRGLTRAAQFVTFIVLARFLSPSEFGWYGILTTAIALGALLGGLGLRQSFAYWIGQQRITTGEGVATSLVIFPILAIPTVLLVTFFLVDASPISPGMLFWTVGLATASALFISLLQGSALGRGEIASFTLGENFPRTTLMIGILALAAVGQVSLASAVVAQAIGFAITVPLMIWLAARGARDWRVRLSVLPPMLGYGAIFAVNLFLLMLAGRISMFFIEATQGAAAAGQFFAAVRINEILLEVATALGMVLFSNAAQQKPGGDTLSRNIRISCWMFWMFVFVGALVVPLAPTIVVLLAGESYVSAAPALQILALGLPAAAAAKLIYPTLAGSGRPYFGTPVILVSLALNTGIAMALTPTLGVVGGATAVVAGQYILFVGYIITCRIRFGLRVRDFFIPRKSDARQIVAAGSAITRRVGRFFRRPT
jgi:O-antigen/teichoic acid export membrane protein